LGFELGVEPLRCVASLHSLGGRLPGTCHFAIGSHETRRWRKTDSNPQFHHVAGFLAFQISRRRTASGPF
jgi:hypothetical protein